MIFNRQLGLGGRVGESKYWKFGKWRYLPWVEHQRDGNLREAGRSGHRCSSSAKCRRTNGRLGLSSRLKELNEVRDYSVYLVRTKQISWIQFSWKIKKNRIHLWKNWVKVWSLTVQNGSFHSLVPWIERRSLSRLDKGKEGNKKTSKDRIGLLIFTKQKFRSQELVEPTPLLEL